MVDTGEPRRVELLVVGGESDPNTRRIADQAAFRGLGYLVADTDLAESHDVVWSLDEPTLRIAGRSIDPQAIFLRHNVFRSTDPNLHGTVREYLGAWPQVRALNRAALGRHNSKAANLRIARDLGLAVPTTIVVHGDALGHRSRADAAEGTDSFGDLIAAPGGLGEWVTKPLFGGAHTMPASALGEAIETGERRGPQLLQRRLHGLNVRIFVVGDETISFAIRTDRLDYREENDCAVDHIPTPASLITPATELARRLGFTYCALDFRGASGDDDLHFLEINSFPMFVRFDTACGNRLADRMLTELVGRNIGASGGGN